VRGDGNCFYRASIFALLESLIKDVKASKIGARQQYDQLWEKMIASSYLPPEDMVVLLDLQEVPD
jgi:Peptidase C65 Otubain